MLTGPALLRRICLVISMALAAPAFAADGSADGPGDLPPAGTASLFDRLVQAEGGAPFPFERMIAAVQAFGRDATPVMVPSGRSLVRHVNDFAAPRILIAATGAPDPASADRLPPLDGRLFVAYSEPLAQLEVLSWNPDAGRFEFQLVENYRPGAAPETFYARRAFCMTCHQDGGPIFPARPWRESNAHAGVADAIRLARGGGGEAYEGAPLRIRLADVEAFDSAVAAGAGLLAAEAVWRSGCGGGAPASADCRRALLAEAVAFAAAPNRFDPAGEATKALAATLGPLWPKAGVPAPDGRILDRDPFTEGEPGWFGRQLIWLGLADDGDAMPPELDPRLPRPAARTPLPLAEAAPTVAAVFAAADRRALRRASGGDRDRIRAAVDRAPADLFADRPVSRPALLKAMLEALGAAAERAPRDVAILPEPRLAAPPPLSIAAGDGLDAFARYCFACHRGSPIARLDIMGGATADEVWDNVLKAANLAASLDWERADAALASGARPAVPLMPPPGSPEHRAFEADRAAGADPLAAMRRAIVQRGGRLR